MSLNFLDFEQPIAELEAKIDSLTAVSRQDEKLDINIDEEVHRLREKSVELTRKIFADLGAWQVAQLARHPMAVDLRPGSDTYLRWHGEVLSAENKKQFLIPAGFAHGFLEIGRASCRERV